MTAGDHGLKFSTGKRGKERWGRGVGAPPIVAGRLFVGREADADDPTGVFFDGPFIFGFARGLAIFGGLGGDDFIEVPKPDVGLGSPLSVRTTTVSRGIICHDSFLLCLKCASCRPQDWGFYSTNSRECQAIGHLDFGGEVLEWRYGR